MNREFRIENLSACKAVARVFPRRTKLTPDDAYVGLPPLGCPRYDEVHISVTFTWDIRAAERLAANWRPYADVVRLGGPAYGARGGEFVPGMYLKSGAVITSRGCPND